MQSFILKSNKPTHWATTVFAIPDKAGAHEWLMRDTLFRSLGVKGQLTCSFWPSWTPIYFVVNGLTETITWPSRANWITWRKPLRKTVDVKCRLLIWVGQWSNLCLRTLSWFCWWFVAALGPELLSRKSVRLAVLRDEVLQVRPSSEPPV